MPIRRKTAEYRRMAFTAFLVSVFLGCGNKSSPPPATTSITPSAGESIAPPFAKSSEFEQYDKQDPCSLLDPKEVEAVLGATLAVPPYRANGVGDPIPTGKTCIYETDKFRYISLDVEFSGGAQVYSTTVGMMNGLLKGGGGDAEIANNVRKNFKLGDGTEMSGEWDEASLTPMSCCIFNAMRGDQLIIVDFSASPATLRQAATLVDSAYKRIDHPLKFDGGAAVAAARALEKTRPQPVDVCSILTRAEVEAIIGPLHADPVSHGTQGCTYEAPPQQGLAQQYEVEVRWRGGYADWRSDQHATKIGGAALAQMAEDANKRALPQAVKDAAAAPYETGTSVMAAPGADPAEAVTNTGLHLAAVKRDVQVSVASRFVDADKAKALIAAVLQKT
jgi:hypothetical protein